MRTTYFRNLNDIPLHNWRMYNETGDMSFLLKSGTNADQDSGLEAWYAINDEYLDKFCNSVDRGIILNKRKRMTLNLLEYVSNGNMQAKMEAEILQVELLVNTKALQDLNSSFMEVITYAEKYLGFQIDEYKTSALKFFTYLELMKKSSNGKKD